jgi:hypothetical protein
MSFGQKDGGKSYTMYGPENKKYSRHEVGDDGASVGTADTASTYNSVHGTFDEDGIVPRSIHDLFMAKEKQSTGGEVNILMTFVEIYNDGIVDLLTYKKAKGKQLVIRDKIGTDGNAGGAAIRGLTSIKLKSSSHARHLINAALKRRVNARSHIICTLDVTINPALKSSVTSGKLASMTSTDVINAKLTLVDLAGSERNKNGTPSKKREKQNEDSFIAKDMFVLGQCISALADQKEKSKTPSKSNHVPFRDCKLTRVLRESLDGNCCTIMLACVTPCEEDLEDSLSALRIAESSRGITNRIKKNSLKTTSLTPAEGAALRRENKILKSHVLDMTRKMHRFRRGIKPEFVFDLENDIDGSSGNEATELKKWRLKCEKLLNLCREANVSVDDEVELTDEESSLLKSYEAEIQELREHISQLTSCQMHDGASITSGLTMEVGEFDDCSLAPSVVTMLSISNQTLRTCEDIETAKIVEFEDSQKQEDTKAKFAEPLHEVQIKGSEQDLSTTIEEKQELLLSINTEVEEAKVILTKLKDEQEIRKDLEEKQLSCDNIEKRATSLRAEVKMLSDEKLALVEEVEDFQNIADLVADFSAEKEAKSDLLAKLECAVKDADTLRSANADLKVELESQRKLSAEESEKRKTAESSKAAMEARIMYLEESLEQKRANQSLEMQVSDLETMLQTQDQDFDTIDKTGSKGKTSSDQIRPPLAKKRKDTSADDIPVVSVSRFLKSHQPKRQKMVGETNNSILFGNSEDANDFNASFDSQNEAFSTGSNSLNSDQKAIRLHAQKLLFWADKATTEKADDSTTLSFSAEKENAQNGRFPTFMTPEKRNSRGGLTIGLKSASPGRNRRESPNPSSASQLSSVKHEMGCSCTGSLFSGNAERSEFFLPRLGLACTCGADKNASKRNADPTALKSFLRTWQVSYLTSVGIFSAEDLVSRYDKYGQEMARAMKNWRHFTYLKPARTKACLVALQIWSRTAKAVLRSHKKYQRSILRLNTHRNTKPTFLEISAKDNDEVSIMSMEEFPHDTLLEGEFEI